MRAVRSHRKHTLFAVTALAAALSLTACQDDDTAGGGSSGDKPSSSAPASDGSSGSSGGSGGSHDQSSNAGTNAGGDGEDGKSGDQPGTLAGGDGEDGKSGDAQGTLAGGDGATKGDPCSGDNSKATIQKVSRPVNHLVLKITNNSSERCDAFSAPLLRFDEAQAPTRILEESQPQSVVGVEPGESAYAAIGLSGADESDGLRDVSNVEVHFAGKSPKGSVGTPVDISLPQGTKLGEKAFVTYWQSDLQAALTH
ncbi:DUF4232 domain-containing protein [Streptomyces albiaxialis]|uniref:DUF4232 domain-containing protein n=1 Tax=Streptomyces albiaxialis TaxID=329523 RepID=A0ABN2VG33_9ACTN